MLHRPGGRDPALLKEDLLPADVVLAPQMQAPLHLAPDFGGQLRDDERPHLGAEGRVVVAEAQVHDRAPSAKTRGAGGPRPG